MERSRQSIARHTATADVRAPASHPADARPATGPQAVAARVETALSVRRLVSLVLPVLAAITLSVLAFAAMAAVSGCGRPERVLVIQPVAYDADAASDPAGPTAHGTVTPIASRSLIFPEDPGLTPVPAEQIVRADWPTVAGRFSQGHTVYYRETWYDRQAIGPFDIDYGYRTFTYTNEGLLMGD